MVFILLTMIMLVIILAIFWGVEWVTRGYSDKEKQEIWKHIFEDLNSYKL